MAYNGTGLRRTIHGSPEVHSVLDQALQKGLEAGFYGSVSVQVKIQDGSVQEIQERMDRKHR